MKKFWKKDSFVLYNVDRLDSHYGNVMIRGWAVNCRPEEQLNISIEDENGQALPVYMERLVRPDVNELLGQPADCESGLHILIDRAVLNTPCVWLIFENSRQRVRRKIRINDGNALRRLAKRHGLSGGMDYDLWIRQQQPDACSRSAQRGRQFAHTPLFSVVIPLYNTPVTFLREIIDSVLHQTYGNVELCLADGSSGDEAERYIHQRYGKAHRMKYCRLKTNRGISENTNSAIRMASGDFIVFADHDDVLAPDALYEMARLVNESPETDVIYTDEDKINRSGSAYFGPHFKPDFSMELLCCNNYICHLFAVRRDVLERAGFLNPEYDGAQDYDFVLRCCEQAGAIRHIPRVLYHWRTHPQSTAGNPASKEYAFEAGRRALEAHYQRMGSRAVVEHTSMRGRYRTRFVLEEKPPVTILIPNQDHAEVLRTCIDSIRSRTTYPNYRIVIVENNSCLQETWAYYDTLAAEGTEILRYDGSFNYAAIHNFAMPQLKTEYVILLNNDTEVRNAGWIDELLGICRQLDVGAVGAKLYYPDGTIQHAGVILGLCGVASHIFVGYPGDRDGYAGRLVSVQDLSAVTAACMMTKRSAWMQVGGMEEALAVSYNDIDYCLKLRKAGKRVVFTPYAELTHYESRSRGLEDTAEKKARLAGEAALFEKKWADVLAAGDPFYNVNLSRTKADCSLRLEDV